MTVRSMLFYSQRGLYTPRGYMQGGTGGRCAQERRRMASSRAAAGGRGPIRRAGGVRCAGRPGAPSPTRRRCRTDAAGGRTGAARACRLTRLSRRHSRFQAAICKKGALTESPRTNNAPFGHETKKIALKTPERRVVGGPAAMCRRRARYRRAWRRCAGCGRVSCAAAGRARCDGRALVRAHPSPMRRRHRAPTARRERRSRPGRARQGPTTERARAATTPRPPGGTQIGGTPCRQRAKGEGFERVP